ncbi:MAG: hypothetical protein VB060_06230, partial [Oscillibacter sp.]|nr:hypothetical protein [Oscillibacter sp.]
MPKLFYPDFFNDVFGPIMQPGSSGSFAGTSRVGRIARYTLKSEPKRVRILFNPGDHHMKSLGNMMDDRGYLGGLQDFSTDDIRLFDAHELARQAGISYEFGECSSDNSWPGSTTFELTGAEGDTAVLTARSIGGGMVSTYTIHGFPIAWQADTFALLAWGGEHAFLHETEQRLRERLHDILGAAYYEDGQGRSALFVEFSSLPDENA